MLLIPYLVLTTLGGAAFLLGATLGYEGIASIGAVIVIITGGAVVLSDLETQTGQTIERDFETIDNETVAVNETVSYQYETIAVLQEFGGTTGYFGFGALQMLAGAVLMTRYLSEASL